jgi:hypothetical protein
MNSPLISPDLMVIGDSLAQGCHSLSVRCEFSSMSYSAQAAKVFKWHFEPPTFPRPVIFDLEEIVREYLPAIPVSLKALLNHLDSNLNDWRNHFQKPPTSGPEYFDNLAVAGSTLDQLKTLSYQKTLATLERNKNFKFQNLFEIKAEQLFDLHIGINSGFVLNPHGKKEYANYNMLEWVKVRKPKRLVVHMGHNDGLYAIGGDAIPGESNLRQTASKYVKLIDDIKNVTHSNQQLIFILLPKISAVANLAVSGHEPNEDGYWGSYEPVFSLSRRTFNATAMERQDQAIAKANKMICDKLETLKGLRKVEVISAYDLLNRLDYKNFRKRSNQVVIKERRFDNRYIKGLGPVFLLGGLESIDGMHPTNIGYAELAFELVRLFQKGEDASNQELLEYALSKEKLIEEYPIALDPLIDLMHIVRNPRDDRRQAILPEQLELVHLLDLLRCIVKTPTHLQRRR